MKNLILHSKNTLTKNLVRSLVILSLIASIIALGMLGAQVLLYAAFMLLWMQVPLIALLLTIGPVLIIIGGLISFALSHAKKMTLTLYHAHTSPNHAFTPSIHAPLVKKG